MKSFLTRLTSGVVLVLLIGWTCWRGSLPLGFFVTVIGGIGLDEFYKVFGMKITEGIGRAGFFGAVLWMAAVLVTTETGMEAELKWLAILAAFMLLMAVYVFSFPKYDTGQVRTGGGLRWTDGSSLTAQRE